MALNPSPYSPAERVAVFVGMEGLDFDFLRRAATLFPAWSFHIFGPWADRLSLPNVHFHGVLPFAATVPYLQHADLALNCVLLPDAGYRRQTLKTRQYTFCRLPIVASGEAAADLPHIFPYTAGSAASVDHAFRSAAAFPRARVPAGDVKSWGQVLDDLLADAGVPAAPHAR